MIMQFTSIHHHTHMIPCLLIGIGLLSRYIISRRRFNRRGVAGLQLFSSYEKWWFVTRFEALIYFLALLAIIGGIILFIIK
jgi:hypothetical protein